MLHEKTDRKKRKRWRVGRKLHKKKMTMGVSPVQVLVDVTRKDRSPGLQHSERDKKKKTGGDLSE